jgi:hypothetical protein
MAERCHFGPFCVFKGLLLPSQPMAAIWLFGSAAEGRACCALSETAHKDGFLVFNS